MNRKISHPLLITFVTLCSAVWACGQSGQPIARLRPIQQNGKWGYIDSTGKIIIEPCFAWAEEFSEGLAAFENEDGKHGYIDETGKVVIEPKFDNWTEFSEGLAAVSIDFNWGYIDKTGKMVIKIQCSEADKFIGGLASIHVGEGPAEKRGYINRQGQYV